MRPRCIGVSRADPFSTPGLRPPRVYRARGYQQAAKESEENCLKIKRTGTYIHAKASDRP